MDEKTIEARLRTLTSKLQRLADDWKHIPAEEYNRQHDLLTETIDGLLDKATKQEAVTGAVPTGPTCLPRRTMAAR